LKKGKNLEQHIKKKRRFNPLKRWKGTRWGFGKFGWGGNGEEAKREKTVVSDNSSFTPQKITAELIWPRTTGEPKKVGKKYDRNSSKRGNQ